MLSLSIIIYSNRTYLALMILSEALILYAISLSFSFGIRMLIWIVYVSILASQITSIYYSGYYIVPLNISNTREVGALGKEIILILSSLPFAFILSSFCINVIKIKINSSWYRYSIV